jgi:hypothetical protein
MPAFSFNLLHLRLLLRHFYLFVSEVCGDLRNVNCSFKKVYTWSTLALRCDHQGQQLPMLGSLVYHQSGSLGRCTTVLLSEHPTIV